MNFFAVLLLGLAAAQEPVARWTFDRDAAPGDLPPKVEGKLDFIESPLGKGGRAAVFNGVDAAVEIRPPGPLGAGAGDFSVSVWMLPTERRPATVLWRPGWALSIREGGALDFASTLGKLSAPPGSVLAGQWNHVLVSVARGPSAGIYVNGEAVATGEVRAGNLDPDQAPLRFGRGPGDPAAFAGLLGEVAVYARAVGAAEAAEAAHAGLPWLRPKAHARTPFPGKFELLQDDVVVIAGGEDARVAQEAGYLETLMSLWAPGRGVHYRSMAWEGDTVFEQPRPLNFGSWTEQFRRCGASVVVAQFGQVESLEGRAGVERFAAAYEALLAQFAKTTRRIVLVSPAPFGKGAPRMPDLAARNADLKLYADAIRAIAAKNGYLFVDLTGPAMAGEGLSRDGLHLSAAGQWMAARETARQLEIPGVSDLDAPDGRGAFRRESLEAVRSAVRAKNALWNDYWRPTNWAFLNGDRTEQPSSRDHVDRRVRWFPVEIQLFPALLKRAEGRIETFVEKR